MEKYTFASGRKCGAIAVSLIIFILQWQYQSKNEADQSLQFLNMLSSSHFSQ